MLKGIDMQHFKINSPKVIHQNIENEVMIIHLDKGVYYNLNQTGVAIWNSLILGESDEDVLKKLVLEYEGNPLEIQSFFHEFCKELLAEGLILPWEKAQENPKQQACICDKQPFIKPVLNKYTDMQELLLLDPIHEVDSVGWPEKKEK